MSFKYTASLVLHTLLLKEHISQMFSTISPALLQSVTYGSHCFSSHVVWYGCNFLLYCVLKLINMSRGFVSTLQT